jgi:hypothetical protein
MHHFRGKLLDGDRTRLDPANVYIQFHHPAASGPVEGWNGYLLVPSEGDVAPGVTYTLTLGDGRSGRLRIDHLAPDDSGKFRAFFVGEGALQ